MRRTAGYFAAFIALGLTVASLGPTLPALAERTGVRYDRISLLFTTRAIGVLTGAYLFGRIYDRWRGQSILAGALVALGLLMAVAPFPTGLWPMIIIFALIGIADGGIDVGGNTLTVWAHSERSGPYLNTLHLCFALGAFIAPVIVATVGANASNILWSYLLMGVLIALPALLVISSPSPELKQVPPGAVEGATSDRLLALLVVFFFLFVGAESRSSGWIFSYARGHGMEESRAAYATSVFWGAFALSRLASIFISTRLSLRMMLAINLAGGIFSLLVLLSAKAQPAAIWAGITGLGWFLAPIFPTMVAFAGQTIRLTAKATAWFLVGGAGGAMFLPWLIGQYFEAAGPQVVIWILLGDLTLASVLCGIASKRAAHTQLSITTAR
jgi:FHS family Na+ dependent glucose MFS transporter 1